jgi:Zn-dependent protease
VDQLVLGILWYVVLLFSLTVHEAAHAWAATRGGDLTAYAGGQVSLDPMPHIRREPFGTILVPLLSFALSGWMIGWASTPYDPRWAWTHPRRAGWMALAGPASNLLLVVAAGSAIRFGMAAGWLAPGYTNFTELALATAPGVWDAVATLLSIGFTLNLLLMVFNLIPVPPLDGSGAIALLVSEDSARRIQQILWTPQLSIIGILIAWWVIPHVFGPVHEIALMLLYPEYLG